MTYTTTTKEPSPGVYYDFNRNEVTSRSALKFKYSRKVSEFSDDELRSVKIYPIVEHPLGAPDDAIACTLQTKEEELLGGPLFALDSEGLYAHLVKKYYSASKNSEVYSEFLNSDFYNQLTDWCNSKSITRTARLEKLESLNSYAEVLCSEPKSSRAGFEYTFNELTKASGLSSDKFTSSMFSGYEVSFESITA